MLFSILIAYYNNFDFFKDCYQSILKQSYQNFEVIIVDDHSQIEAFEKLKELTKNDSRIKIFRNEENKGVGFTKGKCIERASGEICGFLDPDDAIIPEALEISVEEYKKNKNIIATYSKFYICNEHLEIEKIFPNSRKIKNKNPLFFNINLDVAHFFTFRKDAYSKTAGIDAQYKIAEDQDLYLKLYEKGDFQYIDQPLLLYRIHSNGLSHDSEKVKLRYSFWHSAIENALKRRNIFTLYGKKTSEIQNLAEFIHRKQNTIFARLLRKFNDRYFN